jgi:hypothetical protein
MTAKLKELYDSMTDEEQKEYETSIGGELLMFKIPKDGKIEFAGNPMFGRTVHVHLPRSGDLSWCGSCRKPNYTHCSDCDQLCKCFVIQLGPLKEPRSEAYRAKQKRKKANRKSNKRLKQGIVD